MKQILKSIPVLFAAFILLNCSEDEALRLKKVQFTCRLQSTSLAKSKVSAFPDGSVLNISIQTRSGEPVITNQSITILRFGESIITEPIELKPGDYKIVSFMVVNNNDVLYATPRIGSTLAGLVINPLDFNFSVTENETTTIEMDVLNLNQRTAEDLGYTSFNVGIVNSFELSVFIPRNDELTMTSGYAYILHEDDTVHSAALSNEINQLSFRGDDESTYTIDVIKDGYSRYTREFIPSELADELNNEPLKVVLQQAVTMVANITELTLDFDIDALASSNDGSVTINWGDGTSGAYPLDFSAKSHTYNHVGKYFVSITGDLSNITDFSLYYDGSWTDELNLEHLPELTDVRCGYTTGPGTIDLTYNTKLVYVDLGTQKNLEHIILPAEHNISGISINGPNRLTTGEVDAIIDNIYTNTVSRNITNGSFHLRKYFYQDLHGEILGPPSETSMEKLRALRDTYGWFITPVDINNQLISTESIPI